jgi:hypothetical protein
LLSVIALVIANLLVALQALRHEWGYYETLLIYWGEALIIGGYNVLRLIMVGLASEQPFGSWASKWVEFSPGFRIVATLVGTGFFIVKFGTFALIVGMLVVAMPGYSAEGGTAGRQVWAGLTAAGPGVAVALGALTLSHGASFVRNFVMRREYAHLSLFGLVFWPYLRLSLVVMVLAFGLIVARVWQGLGSVTTFAAAMVLAKLAADLVTHILEHQWIAPQSVGHAVVDRGADH